MIAGGHGEVPRGDRGAAGGDGEGDALHALVALDLARDGVEGHLVVGLVLVEVVIAGGRRSGFVVHDEEMVVEVDDSFEVAAEEVGLGAADHAVEATIWAILWNLRPPIQLEPKAQLYRRRAVVEDEGFGGIVFVIIQIVDDKSDKSFAILVLACT